MPIVKLVMNLVAYPGLSTEYLQAAEITHGLRSYYSWLLLHYCNGSNISISH